jgi:hypothetical protein
MRKGKDLSHLFMPFKGIRDDSCHRHSEFCKLQTVNLTSPDNNVY